MTGKRERVKEFGTAEGKKGDQELSWRGGRRASERVAGAFTKRRVNFTSNIDAFHNEQPSPHLHGQFHAVNIYVLPLLVDLPIHARKLNVTYLRTIEPRLDFGKPSAFRITL